ncbi:upf0431 protein c1orf66-like protein [Plakobranchus ocellatus]|uniref:Upf0431 protein c1orf66-like protein n=1 Tax=Plakobranchus ocellatus TaxID=259542 RepID=A0AAV3YUF7_9GAST|nr:upf0431 protein c1orf66-like protein [Plakobranchus ocellatus]
MANIEGLQKLAHDAFEFLKEFDWVHSTQVTHILDGTLHKIPCEWLPVLTNMSTDELNNFPFLGESSAYLYPLWPTSLHRFLDLAARLNIERGQAELKPATVDFRMARGMNPKKLHEVSYIATLIHDIMAETGCDTVVDVGSGLGYLDHVLHQVFGHTVVGLETSESHVSGAESRAANQGLQCEGIKTLRFNLVNDVVCFQQFDELLSTIVSASTCQCKNAIKDDCTSFPLSSYCKKQCHRLMPWHILPQTLRLGAQETRSRWRMQSEEDHRNHIRHIAFRGLLELADCDDAAARRKLVRKCDFSSFKAFQDSYYSSSTFSASEISSGKSTLSYLYNEHKEDFSLIEIFTALQVVLQPVIECLIHHDRLLWLLEQGYSHSKVKIIPVFDEAVSPRNLATVAIK